MVNAFVKWMSGTITGLIILFGVMALFNAVTEIEDYRKLKFKTRQSIHFPSLWVGIPVFVLGTFLYLLSHFQIGLFSPEVKPTVQIDGRWEYIVFNKNGDRTWGGECEILHQSNRAATVKGVRKYMISEENGNPCYRIAQVPWESTWGEICEDNKFRCEYIISTSDGPIHSYFYLYLRSNQTGQAELMTGVYYTLPDFEELDSISQKHLDTEGKPKGISSSATKLSHGTVRFRRMKAAEDVQMPSCRQCADYSVPR